MKLTDEALSALFTNGLTRAAEDHKIPAKPEIVATLVAKFRTAETRKGVALGLGYAHMVMRSFVADCLRAVQRHAGAVARDHARSVSIAREKVLVEAEGRLVTAAVQQFNKLTGIDTLSDWSKSTAPATANMTTKQRDGLHMLWMVVGEAMSFDEVVQEYEVSRMNAWQRVCRARQWVKRQAQAAGLVEIVPVFCDLPISHGGGIAAESLREYVEAALA